jgi:hypothetical protein
MLSDTHPRKNVRQRRSYSYHICRQVASECANVSRGVCETELDTTNGVLLPLSMQCVPVGIICTEERWLSPNLKDVSEKAYHSKL